MKADNQIPVGTMCAMFGLNPNTVRTWERRYDFPSPVRSAGGHRTYSDSDIELIGQIVSLIKSGMAPGDAVKQARNKALGTPAPAPSPLETLPYYEEMVAAVSTHDQALLRKITYEALKKMGYQPFIEELAFPVLNRLGHTWEETGEGVAAEHSFSMLIEAVLLQRQQNLVISRTAPVVTFACVPDELHQMPLLHLANLAAEHEVARPLILAAGLPVSEILNASRRSKAKIILLSATTSPSSAETRAWISDCMDAGWADRIVLAGPGFTRSRVYAGYPVKAAAGNFMHALDVLKSLLVQTD
jgi:MerR family transcriptional regulator, light-induced transcriptional regulator